MRNLNLVEPFGFAEFMVFATYVRFVPSGIRSKLLSDFGAWLDNTGAIELPDLDLQIFAAELSRLKPGADLQLNFMSRVIPVPGDNEITQPGISGGLAGRGLKLLYLMDQPSFEPEATQLTAIVNGLTALQQRDGSWAINPVTPSEKSYRIIGYSHGVAGITYFLLCYYARYQSDELKARIAAALKWLSQQRRSDRGRLIWPVSVENHTNDPWLEHGFSGVALAFIKAFEVFGDPHYKQIAAEVLGYHPVHITGNYCAFGNGLSGLGEIYLEAFRAFGEEEWHQRATAVRGVLLNICYRDQGLCYWLEGTQLEPIPDFWTGNSGILHFLLRYAHLDQINFPFHLIK